MCAARIHSRIFFILSPCRLYTCCYSMAFCKCALGLPLYNHVPGVWEGRTTRESASRMSGHRSKKNRRTWHSIITLHGRWLTLGATLCLVLLDFGSMLAFLGTKFDRAKIKKRRWQMCWGPMLRNYPLYYMGQKGYRLPITGCYNFTVYDNTFAPLKRAGRILFSHACYSQSLPLSAIGSKMVTIYLPIIGY